jgi:flagellar biosynthesis/type III secretory pathway protein FliH
MSSKSKLLNLAVLTFAGFISVACNDRYAEGFNAGKIEGDRAGYDRGYDSGYLDGDEAGYARAQTYLASADYNKGLSDGKALGITQGYNNGYAVGKADGVTIGFNSGYNVGYDDGHADGNDSGYVNGYNNGYDDGYDDGHFDGYDLGYGDGYGDGYDIGYDDGFLDGWGLSVGKSNQLKGYANLLSMAHNDIFDYSKIKAPKQTTRGLVVNGQLLLSETSLTNKDTLKSAAVVEQYLVIEMAKQVEGKFGLSSDRSLKVAKAANHFRKFSSVKTLTEEDTSAYAKEMIGADFSEISKAFESSMKGNLTAMSSVLEKAAEKNETSPENMSMILTELFM